MQPEHKQFLDNISKAAEDAAHIFPTMAACEAALESGFGGSRLAREDSNLFGMKQHKHPVYGTHVLPTKEFQNGQWIVVNAEWIHYPSFKECFQDRMATLNRLASVYPNYSHALAATDAISFVNAVSQSWSTDPQRANKVIAIFKTYLSTT